MRGLGCLIEAEPDSEVEFGFDAARGACLVSCNELGLQELVLLKPVANLVDNAITHAGRGGAVSVGLRQRQDGREIALFVEDDGPGIEEALYLRLGDRFFRALSAVPGGGRGGVPCRVNVRPAARPGGGRCCVDCSLHG